MMLLQAAVCIGKLGLHEHFELLEVLITLLLSNCNVILIIQNNIHVWRFYTIKLCFLSMKAVIRLQSLKLQENAVN